MQTLEHGESEQTFGRKTSRDGTNLKPVGLDCELHTGLHWFRIVSSGCGQVRKPSRKIKISFKTSHQEVSYETR